LDLYANADINEHANAIRDFYGHAIPHPNTKANKDKTP